MNSPLVSVVVPCFNAETLVSDCLKSLLLQDYKRLEIVIIDDCSTDNSLSKIKLLAKHDKRIRLFVNQKNSGPSFTRNTGILQSKGKYVAFFETDMKASVSWISTMVNVFESTPNIGAAHSRVFDLKKKNHIQADGMLLIPHTGWVVMRNYGLTSHDSDSSINNVIIGSVGTMVRRSILNTIGGFDQVLGHKVDDLDLGWRIWLTGYRSVSIPKAITYHWGGKPQKIRAISSLKSEIYIHRMTRVFIKNYELPNLIHYLPWLLFLNLIRAISHLIKGNPNPLKGFFISIVWTLSTLPNTLRQRRLIQSRRKIDDSLLLKSVFAPGNFFQIWHTFVIPTHATAHLVFSKV